MKQGVILVALGYQLYGSCALNLAMSLRAYDPEVEIALVHDNNSIAHLTEIEKNLFNHLIVADEKDYVVNGAKQYQRLKVCVDKYSPFKETIYLDVDNIWFPEKKISWLFGECSNKDFSIGLCGKYIVAEKKRTSNVYTFWYSDIQEIVNYHKLTNDLPQTISGFFYFKKNKYCKEIFENARKVYDDQNAPCMVWANGKPDEYCFNVALSMANFSQEEKHIVYFDKINGTISYDKMYSGFWGVAIGGVKVSNNIVILYNKLVNKYATKLGITTRHYHKHKKDVIKERGKI